MTPILNYLTFCCVVARLRSLFVAGLFCILTINAGAQVVAWQFGSPATGGDEPFYNATTNHADLNVASLSRGSGLTAAPLARGFSSNNFTVGGTKADAIVNNKYYQLVIGAKTGYKVSLSTIDVRLRRTSTGPNMYCWRFSVDGINFNDIDSDVSFTSTADGVNQVQLDLTAIALLQNVQSTSAITLRLYAWGATATTGTLAIGRYGSGVTSNSLQIGGSVAIDPGATSPTITVNSTGFNGNFGAVNLGNTSDTSSFIVSGVHLNKNITITPPPGGFKIRTGSAIFTSSAIELVHVDGTVNATTVDVFFSPITSGSQAGDISIATVGAPTQYLPVTGSSGIATFTWGGSNGSWTVPANWSPPRYTPGKEDILLFNHGSECTITDVPSQNVGQFKVSNNTTVNIQTAGVDTLMIEGGPSDDFIVEAGSSLKLNGSAATVLYIGSGANAKISGTVVFANAPHRIDAADAWSIYFFGGSSLSQAAGCTGNIFSNAGADKTVVFDSAASFIQQAGANPFALPAPLTKVLFKKGSFFKVQQNAALSVSGRSYANIEIDASSFQQSQTGTSELIVEDINIKRGNWALNSTGGITITGNINVDSMYSLSFTPASASTTIFKGNSAQAISGKGTVVFGDNSNLALDNIMGLNITAPVTVRGELTVQSGNLNSAGSLTLASSGRVAPVQGSITGEVMVERAIPQRRAWRLLSVPVSSSSSIYSSWQNGGMYSPGKGTHITGPGGTNGLDAGINYSMKHYDVNTQQLVNVTNTHLALSSQTAYFIFIRGDRNPVNLTTGNSNATTLTSKGNLYTGTIVKPVRGGGSTVFTLVGNPYVSGVDFSALGWAGMANRFYVWDPKLNGVNGTGAYVLFDGDIGFLPSNPGGSYTSGVGNTTIAKGQAFYVVAEGSDAGFIEFNESSKIAGDVNALKPTTPISLLQLSLQRITADSSYAAVDGAVIAFNDRFSMAADNEDAVKLVNPSENIGINRQGLVLTIDKRSIPVVNDTTFLKTWALQKTGYNLKLSATNLNIGGLTAFLYDNYLDSVCAINMAGELNYNFTVNSDEASAATNRFSIVFKPTVAAPVQFVYAKAERSGPKVSLEWVVNDASLVDMYIVQRSGTANNFRDLVTVSNTASMPGTQQYVDEQPISGANYYRIKALAKSGAVLMSEVLKADVQPPAAFTVFPNPAKPGQTVTITGINITGPAKVDITAADGKKLLHQPLQLQTGSARFTLPLEIAAGIYTLRIYSSDRNIQTASILVM